nr:MAG TPA: hypothetical protein [Caudoviricetes sp.]
MRSISPYLVFLRQILEHLSRLLSCLNSIKYCRKFLSS